MISTDPSKIFRNTFALKSVIQHYEKLKVADALEFDAYDRGFRKL